MKKITALTLLTAPSLAFAHAAHEAYSHNEIAEAVLSVAAFVVVASIAYIVVQYVSKTKQKCSSR